MCCDQRGGEHRLAAVASKAPSASNSHSAILLGGSRRLGLLDGTDLYRLLGGARLTGSAALDCTLSRLLCPSLCRRTHLLLLGVLFGSHYVMSVATRRNQLER